MRLVYIMSLLDWATPAVAEGTVDFVFFFLICYNWQNEEQVILFHFTS